MEMCYDGALVMPSRYAVMDSDEMTYVEGGASFYLNADRCATISTYVSGVLGLAATGLGLAALQKKLTAALGIIGKGIKAMLSTTLGVIGFVVACIGTALLMANAVSFCVGCVTADRKNKGVTMSWYGGAFGNFKYS